MRILVVEDNREIAKHVKSILQEEGFKVDLNFSVEEVNNNNLLHNYDLVLLDLMLPGKSGDHLVSILRKKKDNIPILILSGMNQVEKKIDLFRKGADDYLTKPFHAQELIARIKSLHRRHLSKSSQKRECYGEIIFLLREHKMLRGASEIVLTNKEAQILELLLKHRGSAVLTSEILTSIWKVESGAHSNIVQSTMRRLRNKVDRDFTQKLIKTIPGVGYSLEIKENE